MEGNTGTTTSAVFTVFLSGTYNQNVTVNHATANATAAAGSDYVAKPLTTLTFLPGETSKTVSVTVNGNVRKEGNETFKLNLSAPGNATLADNVGTGTITDEEGPIFVYVGNVTQAEGNAGTKTATFTVKLSFVVSAGQTVSRKYNTANSTAVAPSDYVAVPSTTMTFAAGEVEKTVAVTVNGDTTVEPNEAFQLKLSTPVGLVIADTTALGTIQNDD